MHPACAYGSQVVTLEPSQLNRESTVAMVTWSLDDTISSSDYKIYCYRVVTIMYQVKTNSKIYLISKLFIQILTQIIVQKCLLAY